MQEDFLLNKDFTDDQGDILEREQTVDKEVEEMDEFSRKHELDIDQYDEFGNPDNR